MGFFSKLFGKEKRTPIHPEAYYKVTITDESVSVHHPKREPESIRWNEIEEISIINTDEGPFLPDVWLILAGNDSFCSLPQGAEGWEEVYEIVSNYEGFNFENVIKSSSCFGNEIFELWNKNS
ncbi:MAG: hypothetical protein GY765_31805 [bacterium]|nr:hypothetical protein [bacterium]